MARYCTQCGKEIADGVAFCTECGTKAPVTAPAVQGFEQPSYQPPASPPIQNIPQSNEPAVKGTEYEPISTGGFIGIILLMSIPVIGLIITIIWACGGCRKITKRSFARAFLILAAIGIVLSLVFTLVFNGIFNAVSGLDIKDIFNTDTPSLSEKEGATGKLFGKDEKTDNDSADGLLGIIDSLQGMEDIEDIGELESLYENIENENKEIAEKNEGWPKELRPYPGGNQTLVETYRTEITDTTPEDMFSYIEELKKDGFEYRDFYEFGFTEADMQSMNAWWGTDGTIYLSISYAEGKVTIDHTYELPDIENYFG